MGEKPHKKECHRCGGDMTDGQKRRQDFDEKLINRVMDELDSTYAHLRAVIENCSKPYDGVDLASIRHQLVGLLPEVQPYDPTEAEQLRAKGLGHLVDLQESRVRDSWAQYGYGKGATDG